MLCPKEKADGGRAISIVEKLRSQVNLLAKTSKAQQVHRPLAFSTPLETGCKDDGSLV